MAGRLGQFEGVNEPTGITPAGIGWFTHNLPPYYCYNLDYLTNFEKWDRLSENKKDLYAFHAMPGGPYPPGNIIRGEPIKDGELFFTLPERIRLYDQLDRFDQLDFGRVIYRNKIGYVIEKTMDYGK